ncbi:Pkinase-domain-containing protein [Gonapodya prolifera JEL478]|uniref:non-specific serine/threonine protein kinase n=1 Tax=Gonapodya prolifera (strain JEL478) TaxID=1344416 RepID=A0A139AN78_GONPJ|nr:Pkinase-domain-containing protein [Gonapodya prolifera JEL478]|eukprot:KXS17945.1 Pkinase-domain-containing protein [Gonapodya prolifera JEL478]
MSELDPLRRRTANDFTFGDSIGDGSYSTVVHAIEKDSGRDFAIKILDKRHILKHDKAKYVHVEKDVLNHLNGHQFVVRLYYTFQDQASLYFVLEYAKTGDMLELIKKYGSFDLATTRFYVAEIVLALEYIHGKNVIHRDLKPENVLLGEDMHIMLTDFGTAKLLPVVGSQDEGQGGTQGQNKRNSFVGTAEYVSPELLSDKVASKASDFWALGCMTYQMLCGRPPFQGKTDYMIFQNILKVDYTYPDNFPPVAQEFVSALIRLNPASRLGVDSEEGGGYTALKGHAFFEGMDWENVGKQSPPTITSGLSPPVKVVPIDATDFVNRLNDMISNS